MIEADGFLSTDCRANVTARSGQPPNPKDSGQGNASAIAIVEAEMQRVDLSRKWQLRQSRFQIAESGELLPSRWREIPSAT